MKQRGFLLSATAATLCAAGAAGWRLDAVTPADAQSPVVVTCVSGCLSSGGGVAPYGFTPLSPSQNGVAVTSATSLTIPSGATYAVVCAESQSVRWTWDGTTTPTASVGMPLGAGQCISFSGATVLANLLFIQTTATATIDVEYAK